jgi:hypothetical protein
VHCCQRDQYQIAAVIGYLHLPLVDPMNTEIVYEEKIGSMDFHFCYQLILPKDKTQCRHGS